MQLAGTDTDESLYLVVLTMPPGSCLEYRNRDGALVLAVQEGSIVYEAHFTESDDETVMEVKKGSSDDSALTEVKPDTPTTLHAGDWLTQDRQMWFTFRNSGAKDAIISAAGFAVLPWEDPCTGGCHGP